MMTRFASLATVFLGLAVGLSASAQTRDRDQEKNQNQSQGSNQNASKQQTIHGVIAAVTVEGELAIDYRNRRAVETDMTFLTVIGSPRAEDRGAAAGARANDRDANNRENRQAERRRHNVYVIAITPRTQFRDAENDNKSQAGRQALTLADLEVGDRVEVTLNVRNETNTAQQQTEEMRRKHGRHRTYFGDAVTITLRSEPASDNARSADRDRGRDQNDRDQAKKKD
jgi:hypothetical protein